MFTKGETEVSDEALWPGVQAEQAKRSALILRKGHRSPGLGMPKNCVRSRRVIPDGAQQTFHFGKGRKQFCERREDRSSEHDGLF